MCSRQQLFALALLVFLAGAGVHAQEADQPYMATITFPDPAQPLGSFPNYAEALLALRTGSVARRHLVLDSRWLVSSTVYDKYWVPPEDLRFKEWKYFSHTSGYLYSLNSETEEVADYEAELNRRNGCCITLTPGESGWGPAVSGVCLTNYEGADQFEERDYLATWDPSRQAQDFHVLLCRTRAAFCSDWTYLAYAPGVGRFCAGGARGEIAYPASLFVGDPDALKNNNCDRGDGNPCDTISGDKFETATDYQDDGGLALTRSFTTARGEWIFGFEASLGRERPYTYKKYDSVKIRSQLYANVNDACERGWKDIQPQIAYGTGVARATEAGCIVSVDGVPKWRLPIYVTGEQAYPPTPPMYVAHRPDGRIIHFKQNVEGGLVPVEGGVAMTLVPGGSADTLYLPDGTQEQYDSKGHLIGYTQGGHLFTVARQENQIVVSDEFGRRYTATYAGSHVNHIDLPDQTSVDYTWTGNRLTQVTFTKRHPDGSSEKEVEGYGYLFRKPYTFLVSHSYNDVPYASWGYDDAGRARFSEHAGGVGRVEFTHQDGLHTVKQPLGKVFQIHTAQVNNVARLSWIDDAQGTVYERREYDGWGFLKQRTDAFGHVTTFSHDSYGRELSRTEGAGSDIARSITTTWDPDYPYLPSSITTPTLQTNYSYTTAGRLQSQTETDRLTQHKRRTTYTYRDSADGRLVTIDGPRTDLIDTTQIQYDTHGNLVALINALGHTTVFKDHDGSGRPRTIVDPNGLVTRLEYDLRGRLKYRQKGNELTLLTYSPAGDLQTLTLPSGETYTYFYDAARRLTDIKDSAGNLIHYDLDQGDNIKEERVYAADGTLTRDLHRVFNSLGQLWKTLTNAGELTTRYRYHGSGDLWTTSDQDGHTTTRFYDALNRLQDVEDALHHHTIYAYRSDDRVTSIIDPNGNPTTYTYDGFGNLLTQQSPDTGLTQTPYYDDAGNLLTRIDAKGQTAHFTYDALNRLTRALYQGADSQEEIIYAYDTAPNGIGHLASVQDPSGSTSFAYDKLGRVTMKRQRIKGVVLTTRYAYTAGHMTTMTYPSGMVVEYNYKGEQITDILVNHTAALTDIAYIPFGQPTRWTFSNGRIYRRNWNLDGRIDSHTLGDSTRQLRYDPSGNVTGFVDDSTSFDYDPRGRVSSAKSPLYDFMWDYDSNGNRRHQITQQSSTTYTYIDGTNRLREVDDGSVLARLDYDENGNRTIDTKHSYQYNLRNRLATVDKGATARYQYNAFGERVAKSTSNEMRMFSYDGWRLLGAYNAKSKTSEDTVWFGSLPVLTVREDIRFYIDADHLGTPRAIHDQLARVVWRWDSDPFGSGKASEDPDGDGVALVYELGFPGHFRDQESALNYNSFRNYDPSMGMYTQSDPIGLDGGPNTYAYAGNSPTNLVDPTGLFIGSALAQGLGPVFRKTTEEIGYLGRLLDVGVGAAMGDVPNCVGGINIKPATDLLRAIGGFQAVTLSTATTFGLYGAGATTGAASTTVALPVALAFYGGYEFGSALNEIYADATGSNPGRDLYDFLH